MIKVGIIIPAHNEAKAILGVVESLIAFGYEPIVVDDGSMDGTGLIASNAGAVVLSTGQKSGKGSALRLGIAHIKKMDYDVVIFMDGDGQHAPEDVKAFVQAYERTGADVINGNRMNDPKGMPWIRWVTNRFMSWMISLVCRMPIADTQCGFRLMSLKALRAIQLVSQDYEIETEMLIKSARLGFKCVSVDIQTIYRDEVSKIHPIKDTVRFIQFMFKVLLNRL